MNFRQGLEKSLHEGQDGLELVGLKTPGADQPADAGGNYYAWPAGRVAVPSGQAPVVAPDAPLKGRKALKDTDTTAARMERALITYLRGEYQAAAAAVRG